MRIPRPSFSSAVSVLALFVARGGTSYVLLDEPALGDMPAIDGAAADGWRAVAFDSDTSAVGGARVHVLCAAP